MDNIVTFQNAINEFTLMSDSFSKVIFNDINTVYK